jgi:AraC-like DNA-binding protein
MSTADNIKEYIKFLYNKYNLHVTVHNSKTFRLCDSEFAEFNFHCNPYCLYLKTCEDLWAYCISSQSAVANKCKECGSFFGMCHAGVCEYVYTVAYNENVLGFISVSGYRGTEGSELYNKALHKIRKICSIYGLPSDTVTEMYNSSLSTVLPDNSLLGTLIAPLCDMCELYYIKRYKNNEQTKAPSSKSDYLYIDVCNMIRRSHNKKVSLKSICEATNYSESYISHMFKLRSGMTINQYVNSLRITEAKSLLSTTKLPIQEIAMIVGFSDSNYFSNVFRRATGISPREWRNLHNKKD